MNDMYKNFQKYFEIIIADTPELLENVYRIRYQVLCIEQRLPGFDASLYPDKLEKDCYDKHSLHILLRHLPSGNFIGTVRLILNDPTQPEKLLPIELYGQLDPTLLDIKALPRQQTGEISRFVIIGQFTRRKSDRPRDADSTREIEKIDDNVVGGRRADDRRTANQNSVSNCETGKVDVIKSIAVERRSVDRRATPHLGLLLAAGIVRLCATRNINNWLSVMDPALNRLLGYYGLELNPIGPFVDYHGLRRSYFARVEDVLDRMYKEHYDAWEIVTDCGKYNPFLPAHEKVLNQEHIF